MYLVPAAALLVSAGLNTMPVKRIPKVDCNRVTKRDCRALLNFRTLIINLVQRISLVEIEDDPAVFWLNKLCFKTTRKVS